MKKTNENLKHHPAAYEEGSGEAVLLAHGGGGKLSRELVEKIFLPAFDNPALAPLSDAAVCQAGLGRPVLTTDSYVVKPLFFPGGDIGRLAVCGTVNDLSMSGAKPAYLTVGMILEAGLPLDALRKIAASMAEAAEEAGVQLVAGDTKVVEKGFGDGIYINTAGLGFVEEGRDLSRRSIEEGDAILLSGAVGNHGLAVLAAREGLDFEPPLRSDVAPLAALADTLLTACPHVKAMRDPTRGGIAASLNEWAAGCGLGALIQEDAIPIDGEIQTAARILGLDPLYVANEGKFLAIVPQEWAETALEALQGHTLGKNAAIIGRFSRQYPQKAVLLTPYGGERVLDWPQDEQLPRIC